MAILLVFIAAISQCFKGSSWVREVNARACADGRDWISMIL
jgi:hypothetical protein